MAPSSLRYTEPEPLVVELSVATAAHGVQVLVALDRAALGRLYRPRTTITKASTASPTAPTTAWRGSQAPAGTDESRIATIPLLSVVRASRSVVEAVAASSIWSTLVPIIVTKGRIPITASHRRIKESLHWEAILHAIGRRIEVHVRKVESTGCASSSDVIAHWEMTVAVCIATGWCDVCRVENVGIHEIDLLHYSQ
jgi:hypothetical protein